MQSAHRTDRFISSAPLADSPADALLFAGRDEEVMQLYRLLQTSNSVVVYGQYGVGRSSLLNAGLVPLLRERGMVTLRLDWKAGTVEQPFAGLAEHLQAVSRVEKGLRQPVEAALRGEWTLTSLFTDLAPALTASKWPVVIVIDDFETLFALHSAETRGSAMRELGEVLLKRYPTEENPERRAPWKGAPTVKLVISLHQSQLSALDEFREYLPELLTRRVRLAAPNFHQALAILRQGAAAEVPGAECEPFALADEIALPLLAHARLRHTGVGDAGRDLYDLFLLRLLAGHVERLMVQARQNPPSPKPTAENPAAAEGDGEAETTEDEEDVGLPLDPEHFGALLPQLLLGYYQSRVAELPARERARVLALMEASLYGAISQEHGVSRRLLERQYGLSPEAIGQLADSRLLREVVSHQGLAYTLWHDSLREAIRLIRRARSRERLRRQGYVAVGLCLLAAVGYHLYPQEKLGPPEGVSAADRETLREKYADQPERLEAMLRLESQSRPEDPRPLWELATLQEEQGKNMQALQTLGDVEKITPPGNPPLLRRKALLLERLGLSEQVTRVREELLAVLQQPHESEVATPEAGSREEIARIHAELGRAKARSGQVDQARAHFREAIGILGTSGAGTLQQRRELASLHVALGEIALGMEMKQEAGTEFEKALEVLPDFPEALEARASLSRSLGDHAREVEDLARASTASPQNQLIPFQQVQALQADGRTDEALQLLNTLLEKYPENAVLHLRKAQVLLLQGAEDEATEDAALAEFNRTLELDPSIAEAYLGRAQIRTRRDFLPDAIADYTQVIELHPDMARAYGNRGILHRRRGDMEKALADYSKVIEIDPLDPQIYFLRGNLHLDQGRQEEALADYRKATELDPTNARAFNNHGFVLSQLGRHKEAIADFTKAIELDPTFGEAYSNRGFAIYYDNYSTQALADFHRSIILEPERASNYLNRGRYYLEIEEFESSLKDFDKAVELDPESAEAYRFRAQVYLRLGKTEPSQKDMEMAESLSGGMLGE